jgi:hypothetical protein
VMGAGATAAVVHSKRKRSAGGGQRTYIGCTDRLGVNGWRERSETGTGTTIHSTARGDLPIRSFRWRLMFGGVADLHQRPAAGSI